MKEVALASDGFSYERAAIEAHIARSWAGASTCVFLGSECWRRDLHETKPHQTNHNTSTQITAGKTPSSPKTGEPIDPMLLPNLSLRNLIQAFVEEQRRAFLAN